MNAIIGMTGLLLDSSISKEHREYAETIRSSGDALLWIINDILDFSKIEAGKLELEIIDFDLRTCVEETGDMLAPRAHEKGLEFPILFQADVPSRLKGDPGRLRQVLVNLVNNAIKFTQDGEILIRVELQEQNETHAVIRFDVVDTGPGVPADRIDLLFQAFSQADVSTTREYGGTGLGLAISKQLVEAMGGRIWVESEEGKGSSFGFTTMLKKQDGGRVLPRPTEDVDMQGLRILVVDGHSNNRKVFLEQFKTWGWHAEEADDGPTGLHKLRSAVDLGMPFQTALIDFSISGMDCEELSRAIQSEPTIADTPLILVTSVPLRGDAARMLAAGFRAYLSKPVKQSHLYNAIATILGHQEAEDVTKHRPLVTRHVLNERERERTRILVVEDNIVNQKVTARMLEKAGYRCDVAANGREAVEALSQVPYHLVFMDCQMPVMDGYRATEEIRRQEGRNRHTRIIAMTANAMMEDRKRCLDAGMDDYLSKPVTVQALHAMLEKHLAGLSSPNDASEQPENSDTAPADIRLLQEITEGNLHFERELIDAFISSSEQHLTTLAKALQERNVELFEREAHNMKGASANIGARRMREFACRLEQMGSRGELDPASEELARLDSAFKQVRRFLQDYLESRECEGRS